MKHIANLNRPNDIGKYGTNFFREKVFQKNLVISMNYKLSRNILLYIRAMPAIEAIISKDIK